MLTGTAPGARGGADYLVSWAPLMGLGGARSLPKGPGRAAAGAGLPRLRTSAGTLRALGGEEEVQEHRRGRGRALTWFQEKITQGEEAKNHLQTENTNCSLRFRSGGSVVKNRAANAGNARSIPGSGRSPGGQGTAPHASLLAWRIPWTEEPGGLQTLGSQRVGQD